MYLLLPGRGVYTPGFRHLNCTDALYDRCCRRDYSQRHADGVDETPFTAPEAVQDGDAANNAAGRSDSFPVGTHFSSP